MFYTYEQYGKVQSDRMPSLTCDQFDNVVSNKNGVDNIGEYTIKGKYFKYFGTLYLRKTYIANSMNNNGNQNSTENLGHNVDLYLSWNENMNAFIGSYIVNTSLFLGNGKCRLFANKSNSPIVGNSNRLGVKFNIVVLALLIINLGANVFTYLYQNLYFQNNDFKMYIYAYYARKYYLPDGFFLNIASVVLSILLFIIYYTYSLDKSCLNTISFCAYFLTILANLVLDCILVFIYLYSKDYVNKVECEDYTNFSFVNGTYLYPTYVGTCENSNQGQIFSWFVKVLHDTNDKKGDKRECIAFSSYNFHFSGNSTYETVPSLSCTDINNDFDNTMIICGVILSIFALIPLVMLGIKGYKMFF